jgi:hypothetical protein
MRRPSARVAVKVQAHDRTRLRILAYGDDDRVPSPGDLLLIADIGDANSGLVELGVLLPGREMNQIVGAVLEANTLYEENKHWLSAPVTRDLRGAAS